MIRALLGGLINFLKRRTEEQTAKDLKENETDPNVDYIIVKDWKDVGNVLSHFVENYHEDVSEFDDFAFEEFYDYVKQLEYIPEDNKVGGYDLDVFCRPSRTLSADCVCRDCDDKAILMACWCRRHDVGYRFIACSYKPENGIEHCILEIRHENKWVECDSTYPEDTFPSWRNYYNKVILT